MAEGGLRRVIVHVGGMSCSGCEDAVSRAIEPLDGVGSVRASLAEGAAHVAYLVPCDEGKLSAAIESAGYDCLGIEDEVPAPVTTPAVRGRKVVAPQQRRRPLDALYLIVIALGLYVLAQNLGMNRLFQAIPAISGQNIGYAALFVIGLLTSVHCVAMCGGINIAQSTALGGDAPAARLSFAKSSLLYNAGRVLSYTVIGGVLGLVGQAASITLGVRSAIGLFAGAAMLLAGIAMAGGMPFLARLAPRIPSRLRGVASGFARRGPFALGLLNGFMPCGPLQAMQVYAITTGSSAAGALSMLSFSLGTVPLVLFFGIVAGAMKRTWRHAMLTASAVMMVFFGLFMVQSNLAIAGVSLPGLSGQGGTAAVAQQADGVQRVTTNLRPDGYDGIQVRAGVPVEWTIHVDAASLNGCNAQIVLPDFGQQVKLQPGDNVVKFTPTSAGTYGFSCWMGMLHGQITAV